MSRYDEDQSYDQYPPYEQPGPPSPIPTFNTPYTGQDPQQVQPGYSPYNGAAQPPMKRRRRFQLRAGCIGCLLALLSMAGVFTCLLLLIGLVVWHNLDSQLTTKLHDSEIAQQQQTFQTTHIYDRSGNELHQLFGEGRRTNIKLTDVPKSLIDATIAVEDNSFYDNPGVDWVGVARAGLQFIRAGYGVTGGSTITQQLVRDIAFDYSYRTERSLQRKAEEIIMALILTREKSKDEILEMYLNQIYYGNLAYGIEAAAQTYFGKSAKNLTLAESALLAGLPQAPSELDPLNPDPQVQDAVLARRKTVLDLMVEKGKITQSDATAAMAQVLTFANPNVNLKSPHFTLYAEDELKSLITALKLPPSALTTKGYKVYTTLDSNYQTLAENVARQQISTIKAEHNANNAAVVILEPATGEILAMVGSVNYQDTSIQGRVNVAISPKQPGSAMKPLTYAAAMEKGFTAASILWDVPENIPIQGSAPYKPTDYDLGYRGPVRLRYALANSYNIPAVQTLREIGVGTLLNFAERMQVTSLGTDASKYGLSLTLGGGELTPLELTRAYTVLANGGMLVSSTSILCVLDDSNKVIFQYEHGCDGRGGTQDNGTINAGATLRPVLDPRIAFVLSDILADNVARSPAMGSNSPLKTEGIVSSVKTGTTNDFRDNWTVGFTHNVAVGVWVGNTDDKPMVHTTGLTGAAPIWHDIITSIYNDPKMLETLKRGGNLLPDEITPPAGVSRRRICDLGSLKDPSVACTQNRSEWFLDSPALVPDANGRLNQAAPPPPATRVPANGPVIVNVEPDIVQTYVQPLDPSLAAGMVVNIQGLPPSPPPLYCLVPNEVKQQVPTAGAQMFIKPPPFADQAVFARIWAQSNGIAILPQTPCTPEMLVTRPKVDGVTTIIASPQAGDTVTKMVQVTGTAIWPPDKGVFFKMELQGPQFPNWVTFGQTHNTPVVNGLLDQFGAEGLQPGTYKIRITIVGMDGGYLANSVEVPVNVTGQ